MLPPSSSRRVEIALLVVEFDVKALEFEAVELEVVEFKAVGLVLDVLELS